MIEPMCFILFSSLFSHCNSAMLFNDSPYCIRIFMHTMIILPYACTQHHTTQRNNYIATKFDEFQCFINYLLTHNCHIDVINLQETWQCNNTYYNDLTLPGYNIKYFQPVICTTHGGLITYIKSSPNSTLHSTIYKHSTAWEAMFIENLYKSLIIGNIYRPPRESNKLIMSGDFNIILLKNI